MEKLGSQGNVNKPRDINKVRYNFLLSSLLSLVGSALFPYASQAKDFPRTGKGPSDVPQNLGSSYRTSVNFFTGAICRK